MVESIKIRVGRPDDVEPLSAEFSRNEVPKDAAAIARIIREKSQESIRLPEDDLTDEHVFVIELGQALRDFQQSHNIPMSERITLDMIAATIERQTKPTYSSERLRTLYTFLTQRYPFAQADITAEGVRNAQQRRAVEGQAFDDVRGGMRDFWQRIYRAILRNEYIVNFPDRARRNVSEILWEDDANLRQQLVNQMTERVLHYTPERSRVFIRAMYEEIFGPITGSVLAAGEQKRLSQHLAAHSKSPDEPITAAEISQTADRIERFFTNMRRASGARPRRTTIRWMLGALERSAQQPERYLEKIFSTTQPTDLEAQSINATLGAFSPIQRRIFVAVLSERFTRDITGTIQIFAPLRDLAREMRTNDKIMRASAEELADWCSRLANSILEIRTGPDAEEEAAPAAIEATADTVLAALRVKNVRVEPIAHAVSRLPDVERVKVFAEMVRVKIVERQWIKNLPARLGRQPTSHQANALIELMESGGAGTNRTAWEMLLTVANRSRRFREGL